MSGSYNSCINKNGELLDPWEFPKTIENLNDAYEACEEMFLMIHILALGDEQLIEMAQKKAAQTVIDAKQAIKDDPC